MAKPEPALVSAGRGATLNLYDHPDQLEPPMTMRRLVDAEKIADNQYEEVGSLKHEIEI